MTASTCGAFRAPKTLSGVLFLCTALLAVGNPRVAASSAYRQVNLVSDMSGVAPITDPNLVNPWGIAFGPSGPFWIANNHTGVATIYDGAGQPESLIVTIPPPPGGAPPSAPTGIVFNPTSGFELVPGAPAIFLFATEDGTISGWNPSVDPTHAILEVAGFAVYKGLALAMRGAEPTLYAANFSGGAIEVFDSQFTPISLPGSFTDPTLPSGFAPFDIKAIGSDLLVTYALLDADGHDDVPGPGNGFVDVFDVDGNLLRRLITQGVLNSPWGLAIAPPDFGQFSNELIVGNFGDGTINAFDPGTGVLQGTLADSTGAAIVIPGLWGLTFGNGGNGGSPNTLYFTAGIPGDGATEDHGLFGALELAGEPTPALLASFEGAATEVGILLTWRLQESVSPLGFQIYRSQNGGAWLRLDPDPSIGPDGLYRFMDSGAEPGSEYAYELGVVVSHDRAEERFGPVRVRMGGVPRGVTLRVDPSPSAGPVHVGFSVPVLSHVTMTVSDLSGGRICTALEGIVAAGSHSMEWNARDSNGRALPAGVYFMTIDSGAEFRTVRMILVH